MLHDLAHHTGNVRLSLLFGKTNILTNSEEREPIRVCGEIVKVFAPRETAMHLGRRAVDLTDYHDSEIGSRLLEGFTQMNGLRRVLQQGLPAETMPGVVRTDHYANSAIWVCGMEMTATLEQRLASAQRRMLKNIMGWRRDVANVESYVDWIQCCTHKAEEAYIAIGGESWVVGGDTGGGQDMLPP